MKIRTAKFLLALLSLAASTTALSQNNQGQNNNNQGGSTVIRAPEISPAEAMGALTLLGGAIAIVRGFRRKK